MFVTEACEYKDSFLSLKSFVSVILNVQEDHLDYFKNLDNIYKSFNKFAKNTAKNGVLVYFFDEKYEKIKIPKNSISFGLKQGAVVRGANLKEKKGKYSFNLYYLNKRLGKINLPCYGKHNVLNALACIAVCIFLGLSFKEIKKGLESFKGIERRFDALKESKGLIFHDYAHHPNEILNTLKTCREINKKAKIITVFQPHTFSRTRDLYAQFTQCFSFSDEVWLLPIYPAREEPIEGINSLKLAEDLNKILPTRYFASFDDCKEKIKENDKKGNIIAILGAGDIVNLTSEIK